MRRTNFAERIVSCRAALHGLPPIRLEGCVTGLSGLAIDISGLAGLVSVGDRLTLQARDGREVPAEIVGFRDGNAQAMPFATLDGLGPGSPVLVHAVRAGGAGVRFGGGDTLAVSDAWLGRVLDPLGRPLDGRGALPRGDRALRLRAPPPDATYRARLGSRLDFGIRALNTFTTCRRGQRLGLFSGS